MVDSQSAEPYLAEIEGLKSELVRALGAQPIAGEGLELKRAMLGGAGHEAGTLRLGAARTSVVDENLKWHEYDNLYVCDLSVFPRSPAANPTLTLAALALRLASHLRDVLR
jgi:choline dehydrogenase-like flavoprotein